MAYTTLHFPTPCTGQRRKSAVGFWWTTLFCGFWSAVFCGHWSMAQLQFLIDGVTFGLSTVYFMFAYNGIYIRHLVNDGLMVEGGEGHIRQVEARRRLSLPHAADGGFGGYPAQRAPRRPMAIDGQPQGITL